MKKLLIILTVILLAGSLAMHAESRRVALERTFTELDAYAGAEIKYNCSNTSRPYLMISGPTDKINNLEIRLKKDALKIGPKKDSRGSRNGNSIRGVVITVYARMPRSIDASSGAKVTFLNGVSASNARIEVDASSGAAVSLRNITCKSMDLDSSSGAIITASAIKSASISVDASSGSIIKTGAVNCQHLDCEVSSGSVVTISGQANGVDLDASSGGVIKAQGLKIKNASIDKSSGGMINL